MTRHLIKRHLISIQPNPVILSGVRSSRSEFLTQSKDLLFAAGAGTACKNQTRPDDRDKDDEEHKKLCNSHAGYLR